MPGRIPQLDAVVAALVLDVLAQEIDAHCGLGVLVEVVGDETGDYGGLADGPVPEQDYLDSAFLLQGLVLLVHGSGYYIESNMAVFLTYYNETQGHDRAG